MALSPPQKESFLANQVIAIGNFYDRKNLKKWRRTNLFPRKKLPALCFTETTQSSIFISIKSINGSSDITQLSIVKYTKTILVYAYLKTDFFDKGRRAEHFLGTGKDLRGLWSFVYVQDANKKDWERKRDWIYAQEVIEHGLTSQTSRKFPQRKSWLFCFRGCGGGIGEESTLNWVQEEFR